MHIGGWSTFFDSDLFIGLGGWRSGFIYAAIGLILWVGSLAAAFCFYPDLVRPLTHMAPGLSVWTLPIGIGVMEGGVHGLMISQEFRN